MKNNVSQAKRLLLACQRQVCCAGKVCNTWPLSMRVIMRSMRQGSQGTFSSSSTGWTRGWFQHSYEISNSQGQAALFFQGRPRRWCTTAVGLSTAMLHRAPQRRSHLPSSCWQARIGSPGTWVTASIDACTQSPYHPSSQPCGTINLVVIA